MSPKNKGKFGRAQATAIPETDEFISGVDRVMRALRPHVAKLAVLGGFILVGALIAIGWNSWKNRKAEGATDRFAMAVALSQVRVEPVGNGEKPAAGEPPAAPEKPVRPPDPRGIPNTFPTAAARAEAVLAALAEVREDYGSTGPGEEALLLEADALYELGKYADAAARYREFIDAGGPDDLVVTAKEGLGYALEAVAMAEKDAALRSAGLAKAVAAFAAMQDKPDGPRRDEAMFHQARLLAAMGKKDEAVKMFQQVLTDHPESALKPDVELRLLALNLAPAK